MNDLNSRVSSQDIKSTAPSLGGVYFAPYLKTLRITARRGNHRKSDDLDPARTIYFTYADIVPIGGPTVAQSLVYNF